MTAHFALSTTSLPAQCGPRVRGRTWGQVLAVAFLLPGVAGAATQCPASTSTRDIQPVMVGQVLMCNVTALARPTCPSTHPTYQVHTGRDACLVGPKPPAQVPKAVQPLCPPAMELKIDWGPGSRDRCRGLLSANVAPTAAAGQL